MKNKKGKILMIVLIVLVLGTLGGTFIYKYCVVKTKKTTTNEIERKKVYSKYQMSGNGLESFDLSFLKLENENKNMVYSPLSIKYALNMLRDGASGTSFEQLDAVLGKYNMQNHVSNTNMSFANALFIRDKFKDKIESSYITNIKNKYNAEVIFDTFNSVTPLNSWVSDKTLGLIPNMFENIDKEEYILVNALAIDMNWNKTIQNQCCFDNVDSDMYYVFYNHEKYHAFIEPIDTELKTMNFNNTSDVDSLEIGASINNYDIIKELGEENIRKTVGDAYQKWLEEEAEEFSQYEPIEYDVKKVLDKYLEELAENYKRVDSSTDFAFYDDENVKVFAKDLRQYDGTTLQYIGFMPKNMELTNYIEKLDTKEINNYINKLKTIELANFEYGKVYQITGHIPVFKFDYTLDLKSDLNKLGIKDVFDSEKSDLSKLTKEKNSFIGSVAHKANIEFSNIGIKASAATEAGGWGSAGGGFDYIYDVPVEVIDLTFDKPYLFLIRDKNTGEVWFSGKVYQPTMSTSN